MQHLSAFYKSYKLKQISHKLLEVKIVEISHFTIKIHPFIFGTDLYKAKKSSGRT